MADLNFTTGNTLKQSLRASPSRYDKSKLRFNYEQSEGQRVSEVFYPHKFLPVQFQDTNTTDWVVIPKGKIVACLGLAEYLTMAGGMPQPYASGTIPVFQNRSNTVVTVNVDSSIWGYNESVTGLLIPANGGQARTTANSYEYQTNDVTAGTYKSVSALAAAGDDVSGALISGNYPIGVAQYDIYQDIRGQKLNYQVWDKSAILNDYYVTVPFIREGASTSYNTALSREETLDDSTVLDALRRFTFMTIPSGYNGRAGAFVKADPRGNYTLQNPLSGNLGLVSVNRTIQTVGSLITLDCRWPKDMLEYVDTYPDSQMAGTDTGGLPYWLFMFSYEYIKAKTGSAPTINTVVDSVRNGRIGMARINLHVN